MLFRAILFPCHRRRPQHHTPHCPRKDLTIKRSQEFRNGLDWHLWLKDVQHWQIGIQPISKPEQICTKTKRNKPNAPHSKTGRADHNPLISGWQFLYHRPVSYRYGLNRRTNCKADRDAAPVVWTLEPDQTQYAITCLHHFKYLQQPIAPAGFWRRNCTKTRC